MSNQNTTELLHPFDMASEFSFEGGFPTDNPLDSIKFEVQPSGLLVHYTHDESYDDTHGVVFLYKEGTDPDDLPSEDPDDPFEYDGAEEWGDKYTHTFDVDGVTYIADIFVGED